MGDGDGEVSGVLGRVTWKAEEMEGLERTEEMERMEDTGEMGMMEADVAW